MEFKEVIEMKKEGTYLPTTMYAVTTLGAQIAIARKDLGWTAGELADAH